MNANEIADKLQTIELMGYHDASIALMLAPIKLRQQQADLKDADKYALELERLYEDAKAEIEALKEKLSLWEEFGRQVVGHCSNEGTR